MKIRSRKERFTRCGFDFNREWREIDQAKLTPDQLEYLTSEDSLQYLEIEGGPPPKTKPDAADAAAMKDQAAGVAAEVKDDHEAVRRRPR